MIIYKCDFNTKATILLGRGDRLEIRTSDSTLDSPKPSDRFDNSETQIRNRENSLVAGFTVLSVVCKAAAVDHRY